jgi:hypothetical protein
VAGGVITLGTIKQNVSNSTGVGAVLSAPLTSTTYAIIYYNSSTTYMNAVVCSVAGTTITPGAINTSINNDYAAFMSVASLSSTSFVLVYRGSSTYMNAVVCTVSGTTITPGSVYSNIASSAVPATAISATALSATSFVATYMNNSTNFLDVIQCSVTGYAIATIGSKSNLVNGQLATYAAGSAVALSPTSFACAYANITTLYAGSVAISCLPTANDILPSLANATVSSGASGTFTVVTPGTKYTNAAYNLTPMTKYYVNTSSQLTTSHTGNINYYVGMALDATSILIDGAGQYQTSQYNIPSIVVGDIWGETIVDAMAASATVGQVLYLASGGWTIAKADAAATMPALGLCVETGTGNRKILTRGFARVSGWSFTKGQKIYVSAATAGSFTATAPAATGQQVQIIGVALSTDIVYFFFDSTYVEI